MSDELIQHYTQARDEDRRLTDRIGPFEYERTISLIGNYLGPEKSTIVDSGGGTGPYALWLAEQGHVVHLVDLVPRHVDRVKRKVSERSLTLGSAHVGDARSLPFEDAFADLVLLMGPLYHLTDQEDRILALREAARVLKPGGRVFCAAISRFASMFAGFRFNRFDDPEFEGMVDRDLLDGQHRNPVSGSQHLTTAYLHKPSDLRDEIERAGLQCEKIIGIESPLGLLPEMEMWIAEKGRMYDLASGEFDPLKSAANEAKHGIDFVEAQALWSDPDRIELPARPTNEPRFLIVGQIKRAVWTATVTYRHEETIRLISVRRARHNEEAQYVDARKRRR